MFHLWFDLPWYSVRFSSSVTGSILVDKGHYKIKQRYMVRCFPLNAEGRSELEKVLDVDFHPHKHLQTSFSSIINFCNSYCLRIDMTLGHGVREISCKLLLQVLIYRKNCTCYRVHGLLCMLKYNLFILFSFRQTDYQQEKGTIALAIYWLGPLFQKCVQCTRHIRFYAYVNQSFQKKPILF